jgi:hypothetical protein
MQIPLRPLHAIVAIAVTLLIPATPYFMKSRRFGWTMFSQPRPYRMSGFALSSSGKRHTIVPTALGAALRGEAARYLAGAESWRPISMGDVLAAHLDEFAREACKLGKYSTVTLRLEEKPSLDGPIHETIAHAECTERSP